MQERKEHKQQKWVTEGHSTGLCLSMVAHACALFCGAILLEEAETQTDTAPTTCNGITVVWHHPCGDAICVLFIVVIGNYF
jgi:hypothetical protein